VEGDTDVPVAQRLLELVGLEIGTVYGLKGKDHLDERLPAYNKAAHYSPWLVLRDLNRDAACAPGLVRVILPRPAARICFRIAVRAAEAWLLADRERIAGFLGVPVSRVPTEPDGLANPKQEIVNLARRSRRRAIQQDMVPDPRTSGRVGPGYSARLIEYALERWRPRTAAAVSTSLSSCITAVEDWAAAVKDFVGLR